MCKNYVHLIFIIIALSFTSLAQAIVLTPTTDPNTLINNIVGAGITVSPGSGSFTGTTNMAATFSDGENPVGFNAGIVLMTGNVDDIPGPNPTNSVPETEGLPLSDEIIEALADPDVNRLEPGDQDLSSIVGAGTFDAAVLEFEFQFGDGSIGGDLFFNFVFASEEYIDFVNSAFNDVFALFVDGENIALIPDTNTPIAINSVNASLNSAFYRNNVENTNGFPNLSLDTALDGLTTVIAANKLGLGVGLHQIKFAVADTSDGFLDSAVFIEAGSFSDQQPEEQQSRQVSESPIVLMILLGFIGFGFARRECDFVISCK